MEKFDYWCEEFWDDNEVMEVCQMCLRLRVASLQWIKPTKQLIYLFAGIKSVKILTYCPDCLEILFRKEEK